MSPKKSSRERRESLLSSDANVSTFAEPSADERITEWLAYKEDTLQRLLATKFLTPQQIALVDTELKKRIDDLQAKYHNEVYMTAEERLSLRNWQRVRAVLEPFLPPAKTR